MDLPKILQNVNEFVDKESRLYSDQDKILFTFSCHQFIRYLEFIDIIYNRYKASNYNLRKQQKKLIEYSHRRESGPLPNYILALLEKHGEETRILHIEIESFFIFSKIYIDKIAQFINNFLGSQRSLSLQSHGKLKKNFNVYINSKNLKVPKTFLHDIDWFEKIVVDTRDKKITHQKNPRSVFGTMYSDDISANIAISFLNPMEKDSQVNSPDIHEIVKRLILYTMRLLRLVKRNRIHSRYHFKI